MKLFENKRVNSWKACLCISWMNCWKKKLTKNCQRKSQQINAEGISKSIVGGQKNAECLAGLAIFKGISKKFFKNWRNKEITQFIFNGIGGKI